MVGKLDMMLRNRGGILMPNRRGVERSTRNVAGVCNDDR